MSNYRAIAEVTVALQQLLQRAIALDDAVGGGKVTSRPPDKARAGDTGNQLNLFLYRTAVNAALRNHDPWDPGTDPIAPPLPLVLSYVVTAYGAADDDVLAHRLLGIAMSTFHDNPVLDRTALADPGLLSEVDRQPEQVKITPAPVPQDELSRMWSTFGTGYRVSVTYDVSVVSIDSTRPRRAPAPVLRRGSEDRGPVVSGTLAPSITALVPQPLRPDPAAGLAATLLVRGGNLGGVTRLVVRGRRLEEPVDLVPDSTSPTELRVTVPADALPAGTHVMTADLEGVGGASPRVSLAVAPTILEASPLQAPLSNGEATVRVSTSPRPLPDQQALLLVGERIFTESDRDGQGRMSFTLTELPKGSYPVRLRLDGQDSVTTEQGLPALHQLVVS
jgi:Pvc16 N-terminal domain